MAYFIYGYRESFKGININGARLYLITDEKSDAKEVLEFRAATTKGWKSSKPILVDFAFEVNTVELAGPALQITDEIAEALIAKYKGVEYKIYTFPDSRCAGAWAHIAANYMHDPYDTSGAFGSASCNQ